MLDASLGLGLRSGCHVSPCGVGAMARRRFVARGVPGGYRIWDSKIRRWWGDHYELCPDDLLAELNGSKDLDKISALLKR